MYIGTNMLTIMDIVVHKNIRLSDVIVSDILDSDHLPICSTSSITLEQNTIRNHLKNLKIVSGLKA
jgi:hypothetical protein